MVWRGILDDAPQYSQVTIDDTPLTLSGAAQCAHLMPIAPALSSTLASRRSFNMSSAITPRNGPHRPRACGGISQVWVAPQRPHRAFVALPSSSISSGAWQRGHGG